jgi:cytochrome c
MSARQRVIGASAAVILAGGAALVVSTLRHGISARAEPTRAEILIARAMRHAAVPKDLRTRANPLPLTAPVLEEAKAHFADHCASCHGNDGRGQTAIGQGLYPRAPDMTRPETQSLGDGEIFAIIENGVRLTGMPAWGDGTPASANASWALVHYIRHLPRLTPEEAEAMARLNPKSREEWQADSEADAFLRGGSAAEVAPPAPHAHHR